MAKVMPESSTRHWHVGYFASGFGSICKMGSCLEDRTGKRKIRLGELAGTKSGFVGVHVDPV